MRPTSFDAVVAALPLLVTFSSVLAQDLALKPMVYQGCYSSSTGMTSAGYHEFQSSGYCQKECVKRNMAVMGTTKGTDCWCGNLLPPSDSKTSDSTCDSKCSGYGQDACGGPSSWSVLLTGLNNNVESASESNTDNSNSDDPDSNNSDSDTSDSTTSSPSPSTTKNSAPSVVTRASTIVVTAAGHTQAQTTVVKTTEKPKSDGGPNVAGITAGVVVGVVALSAIAGGLFFYLRNRKRKALEKEYRQNAAGSYNTLKPSPSSAGSASDSRLEPSVMMQRRQSDGSIADNQDYSRRILKVTNPDGS
ncbi:MAG: hypothetical protein Q9217_004438 [Psora testacea]